MAELITCSSCKRSIPADSKFCPFCGGDQAPAQPRAGAGIEPRGQSQGRHFSDAGTPPRDQPSDGIMGWLKRNKILAIGLAVVTLLLACCVCSYLLPFFQTY